LTFNFHKSKFEFSFYSTNKNIGNFMAHEIDYELIGDDMQAAIITLDANEMVQAEAGSMMFMTDGIQMNTGTGPDYEKG